MPICDMCGKFISAKKLKRHRESRCRGGKVRRKMPKRRGTGLDPKKVVIVGGDKQQRALVEKALGEGELDDKN